MWVEPWFAQPDQALGTAICLPGRRGGVDTPVMHWPATLLTEIGWSVLCVTWDEASRTQLGASDVQDYADAALDRADQGRPVLLVAKSLGTFALPWAVEHQLPGVWLTPLVGEPTVLAAVESAQQPTLLVGGTADPYWQSPERPGSGVEILELPGADHGLHQPGDWRRSLLDQVRVFDAVSRLAEQVLRPR